MERSPTAARSTWRSAPTDGSSRSNSPAGNLVAGDGDEAHDVFVHDRRTGETEGISTRAADRYLHRYEPALLDLRRTAVSSGSNRTIPTLVRRDANGFFSDVFVVDCRHRTLRLVSRNSDGVQGNDDSVGAQVSADGRFVVFSSRSSNLVRRDTNQSVDVFRRYLEHGTTERLAADDTSEDLPFGFEVIASDITPDAREVALLTRADSLLPEQDIGFFAADVYVFDPRRGYGGHE